VLWKVKVFKITDKEVPELGFTAEDYNKAEEYLKSLLSVWLTEKQEPLTDKEIDRECDLSHKPGEFAIGRITHPEKVTTDDIIGDIYGFYIDRGHTGKYYAYITPVKRSRKIKKIPPNVIRDGDTLRLG